MGLLILLLFIGCNNSNNKELQASKPQPKDKAEDVKNHGRFHLKWEPAMSAVSHRIYVGSDKEKVAEANTASPEFKSEVKKGEFPLKTFKNDSIYWRIDEVDKSGEVTRGEIWSFYSARPAFPGAEGFGKYSTGGRGGDVIEVTNLEDLDENGNPVQGSFRAALNTEGNKPITIVFKISGNISLEEELKVNRSNITIAGQTAPGDGITIKDHTVKLSGENLIIRYVRFRPGDLKKVETTALNIENSKNVIVDHCSMSWAVEENMGFYDNKYSTVQWCILSEGLYDSFDPKGKRSYGSQWGGQYSSYHHNLLAHNYSRSPRINGSRAHDTIALVDFRNNVIFNWGRSGAIYGGEEEIPGGKNETNFVNNYYKPGSGTSNDLFFASPSQVTAGDEAQGYGEWYFSGNFMEGVEGGMNDDNWLGISEEDIGSVSNIRSDNEFQVAPVNTQTAQEALKLVLNHAGVTVPERDAVDKRIIAEAREEVPLKKKGIINSQAEVGGWPKLESLPAPKDSDKDGMPDEWEIEHTLNPENPEDGKAIAPNGYTYLEIYLDELTKQI